MRIAVVIASEADAGTAGRLPAGDRAAVHWGIGLSRDGCCAHCPAADEMAAAYARAAGARIAAWDELRTLSWDLAVIGPGAIDRYGDRLAGELAESKEAELLFDVLHVEGGPRSWRVTCNAGCEARDLVTVSGPAVLVVSHRAPRAPYISRYRLTMASVEGVTCVGGEGDPSPPHIIWGPVTPRGPRAQQPAPVDAQTRGARVFGIGGSPEPVRERAVIVEEPQTAARLLLRYLAHRGFVSRTVADAAPLDVPQPLSAARPEVLPPVAAAIELLPVTTASGSGLWPAGLERSPRTAADSPARRGRRPRPVGDAVGARPRPRCENSALRRAPRRLDSPGAPAGRGPYRIAEHSSRDAGRVETLPATSPR